MATMAIAKENSIKNKSKLESSIFIISVSFVGISLPSKKTLIKTAINSGICPITEARITTNEPTIYFQNLFSGVTPCSTNIKSNVLSELCH